MKRWKCSVCGKIFEGESPPVPCPVCKAGREAFIELSPATTLWKCSVCGKVFEGAEPPVPCPVCKAGREAFEKVAPPDTSFKKDTQDDFVIIGAGVAGLEAARAIRLRNATASITLVNGEAHLPYNRPGLSDALGKGQACEELSLELPDFYKDNNICLLTGAHAQTVDAVNKQVSLADGRTLPYTRLLLATGAYPFNPIRFTPESVRVQAIRTYDDIAALIGHVDGKNVVLVGGGILGLEAALALRERGCKVTIVEFAPRILSLQADEEVSRRLQSHMEEMGFTIVTGASVDAADARGAVLQDGTCLPADLVLASMGVRSEVTLAVDLGLNVSRGIVVDEHMKTSRQDIYAAGDCAEFGGQVRALASAAAAMGEVAGAAMAGDEALSYTPLTPSTVFICEGFELFSVGALAGNKEETALYENAATGLYRRLFFEDGKLTGALFVGNSPGAKAIAAVQNALPVAKAAALLGG